MSAAEGSLLSQVSALKVGAMTDEGRKPFCWHFWRKRYKGYREWLGLCDECLKRHPDYWKWKLQWRKESAIRMDNDIV
jgi:hypothetical protein